METVLTSSFVAALFALATLFALAAPAGAAAAPKTGSCPGINSLGDFVLDSNVGAIFSNNGNTTTYTFISFVNENSKNGVPGLIKYCVYPDPAAQPQSIHVDATGDDGSQWISGKDSQDFFFGRPGGNKTNIPLDGTATVMGTATWTDQTLPDDQVILLHIADTDVCHDLYGKHHGHLLRATVFVGIFGCLCR